MTVTTREAHRLRRRRRVRAKVSGSAERPRISVFRSNRGISAQLIDDDAGRTLAAVNWTEAELRSLKPLDQAHKAGGPPAQRGRPARSSRPPAANLVTTHSSLPSDTPHGIGIRTLSFSAGP